MEITPQPPREFSLPARALLVELAASRVEAERLTGLQVLGKPRLELARKLVAPGPSIRRESWWPRRVSGCIRRYLGFAEMSVSIGSSAGLDRAGEDAVERVIVFAGDRVELVVVAAGAGRPSAQQAAADHVDAVVDDLVLIVAGNGRPTVRNPSAASGRRSSPGGELVGGELLDARTGRTACRR